MSMEPKIAAYAYVTFDEGAVTAQVAYNCTVADAGAGDGDFNLTIGEGGVDRELCIIKAIAETAAGDGATSARNASTIHTSDTVKRIQFRDDAGTIVAPVAAWIEIKRMPPLPEPGRAPAT